MMNRLAQTRITHDSRERLYILLSSFHHTGGYYPLLFPHQQTCPLSLLWLLTRDMLSNTRKPFTSRVPLPPLPHSQTSLPLSNSIFSSLFLPHTIQFHPHAHLLFFPCVRANTLNPSLTTEWPQYQNNPKHPNRLQSQLFLTITSHVYTISELEPSDLRLNALYPPSTRFHAESTRRTN